MRADCARMLVFAENACEIHLPLFDAVVTRPATILRPSECSGSILLGQLIASHSSIPCFADYFDICTEPVAATLRGTPAHRDNNQMQSSVRREQFESIKMPGRCGKWRQPKVIQ